MDIFLVSIALTAIKRVKSAKKCIEFFIALKCFNSIARKKSANSIPFFFYKLDSVPNQGYTNKVGCQETFKVYLSQDRPKIKAILAPS